MEFFDEKEKIWESLEIEKLFELNRNSNEDNDENKIFIEIQNYPNLKLRNNLQNNDENEKKFKVGDLCEIKTYFISDERRNISVDVYAVARIIAKRGNSFIVKPNSDKVFNKIVYNIDEIRLLTNFTENNISSNLFIIKCSNNMILHLDKLKNELIAFLELNDSFYLIGDADNIDIVDYFIEFSENINSATNNIKTTKVIKTKSRIKRHNDRDYHYVDLSHESIKIMINYLNDNYDPNSYFIEKEEEDSIHIYLDKSIEIREDRFEISNDSEQYEQFKKVLEQSDLIFTNVTTKGSNTYDIKLLGTYESLDVFKTLLDYLAFSKSVLV